MHGIQIVRFGVKEGWFRFFCVLLFSFLSFGVFAQVKQPSETKLSVSLRGVFDAKVSLSRYANARYDQPMQSVPAVTDRVEFRIPDKDLPGQFLIRMDYRRKAEDQPYPSELIVFLNKNDIELGVNPLAPGGDSVFYKNDTENNVYQLFMKENSSRRQQLALLGQVLELYAKKDSRFYKETISEFELLRKEYNSWVDEQFLKNKESFVSCIFPFQKVVPRNWNESIANQIKQQPIHYFDHVNFKDTLMIRTQAFNDFINAYMGMFGMQVAKESMRDSVFTQAGLLACRKASEGHPKVYGWMVDYFYRGFESHNITSGIAMLRQFIDDPNCLTSKKQEILKRLEGMQRMKKGSVVPEFEAEMYNGMKLRFDGVSKQKSYEMIVFYESNCSHCKDLLKELKEWYAVPQNKVWFDIISVAMDDNRTTWEKSFENNKFDWSDVWASGGVNSKLANDYYILSTPVIYIVDKQKKVMAIPQNVKEIVKFLNP